MVGKIAFFTKRTEEIQETLYSECPVFQIMSPLFLDVSFYVL
jgi:hypothetical protein